MCPQRLGCIKPQWSYTAVFLAYANASKLVVLHHAKQNPGVFLDVLLQVFRELLIAFGGDHRQRVDHEAMQPLTIVVVGTSIGTVAAIFPMVVMCTFATSRLVEQNLVPVDPGVIEAARSMGAGKLTIIRTVLIPEALAPLILAYAFLFIGVLDMSAMAGYIGGGGLGNFAIAYGYQKFDQTVTWTAVIIMIVLVQVVQGIANAIAKRLLKRQQ